MVELKLWILTGINGIVLPALIFFISRWMRESDREKADFKNNLQDLYNLMNKANMSIAEVRLTIEQNKSWMCERFISEKEFIRRMEDMKEDLKDVEAKTGIFNLHNGNGK